MREPVRSAPPPPGGRPASVIRADAADTITKQSVLEAVGPRVAPARPSRAPPPSRGPPAAQPAAPRRHGVRPPPKKKPPPRPPPPKFQEFSRRDTPPTYEQVLQEDAAVLAGFGFGGERTAASAAPPPPLGADLIDFDAPVSAPPLPATPLAWDSPPAARRAAPAPAAPVPLRVVTVIRPVKPAGAVSRSPARPRQSAAPRGPPTLQSERDGSPPMPSVPPPPPPALGLMREAPTMRPPTPPPRPGSSASCSEPPQATALYDFHSDESGDLSFEAGEVVQLVERVNTEWLRGRCGFRQGIFPEAYVRVTVPLSGEPEPEPEPEQEPEQQQEQEQEPRAWPAVALYDFAPQESQDLALTAGQRVQVQGRLNDEWGFGSVGDRSGQFPLAFVDVQPGQLPML